MSIADELERLGKMKADGLMTEEEFSLAKAKLLASQDGASSAKPNLEKDGGAATETQASSNPLGNLNFNVNQWTMFIHLSGMAILVFPVVGAALPILLWQIKKDESEVIDRHGKMVANWMLSLMIYFIASAVLTFVLIGLVTGLAVTAITVVFAILGGLKANDGEFWEYPLTIKFIK